MRLYRFVMLSTLTVSLLNSAQLPVLGQSQDINDGKAIPAEIVLRLLSWNFLEAQQILLYELPDNLPVQLPLPDQATVLASVIYQVEGFDSEVYRVLLNATQAPDVVVAQYRQQLESLGWQVPDSAEGEHGGFVASSAEPNIYLTFCSIDKTQQILVTASPQSTDSTALELNLLAVSDDSSSCHSASADSEPSDLGSPMPLLSPPPGAIVLPQGTSWSSESGSTEYSSVAVTARIESELSADAIAQHYAAQWEAAGWVPQSEESDGSVNKVWMLENETGQLWRGTLTINPAEEAGEYSAVTTVEILQEN